MRFAYLPGLVVLSACSGGSGETGQAASGDPCLRQGGEPTDEAALAELLAEVLQTHQPQLQGLSIELLAKDSEQDFFSADFDVTSAAEPGPERSYRVRYGPRIFESPPPTAATAAILVHELQHIDDYVGMDTAELSDFILWYATGDFAEYERATDEVALEAGCGEGLKAYRLWLYEQVDADTEAQKRLDYYTPEEIDAWMAARG